MNNVQKFRAEVRKQQESLSLGLADWRGRGTFINVPYKGTTEYVQPRRTTPGTPSNKVKRRDINRARLAARRLAASNMKAKA